MTSRLTLVLIAVLGLAPASANWAAKAAAADKPKTDKPDDAGSKNDARLKELQGRFKQRYEKIKALKSQGVVGETFEGYVDFVTDKKPADAATLVEDENKDRKELYTLIAEKENTTADLVGKRNAKRNFTKAASGEYLKGEDGKWTKKA